jgi:MFS family permease
VSDVFGRKPTLYFGIFLFALGSLVFAIAQNMVTVVVGRVLQGIGGGGMDLMSEIIVADMTTLQERSLYLGLLAIPTAIGSILGPTLGALFTANVSWRWIGWINLPILGVSLFLIVVFLRLRPIDSSIASKLKRVDWGGSFLSLAGITLFVVPLSWANSLYPWRAWETLVPLLIGAVLVFAFMMYEFRIPKQPIFPLRLFHSRTVHLTLLGNFAYGASLYSVLQYLPLFYQAVTLRTAIGAAVTLLPTSIVSVVFAVGGVIMVGVLGKGYVWAIIMYWVILTVGSGLLGLLGENSSASMLLGLPILWSSAIGALMRLLHLPLQASVSSVDDTGLVIGLLLVVRLLGGVVGLAMSSSIFNSVFEASTRHLDLLGPLAPLRDASQAVSFIPQLLNVDLPPETLDPVLQAYATAMRAIFYTMTGFSGVGLLTALFTQDVSLKRTELGRQRFEN